MKHTLIAKVENKPGVLNRVSSLFRRRNFNIDALNVGRTEDPAISRMTITMEGREIDARKVEANLYKLVNVTDVQDASTRQALRLELAMIKIAVASGKLQEVISLAQIFDARIADLLDDAMIVQITSSAEKIDSLIEALRPYDILELVRTGDVAMMRGREEGIRHTPGAGDTISYMNGSIY